MNDWADTEASVHWLDPMDGVNVNAGEFGLEGGARAGRKPIALERISHCMPSSANPGRDVLEAHPLLNALQNLSCRETEGRGDYPSARADDPETGRGRPNHPHRYAEFVGNLPEVQTIGHKGAKLSLGSVDLTGLHGESGPLPSERLSQMGIAFADDFEQCDGAAADGSSAQCDGPRFRDASIGFASPDAPRHVAKAILQHFLAVAGMTLGEQVRPLDGVATLPEVHAKPLCWVSRPADLDGSVAPTEQVQAMRSLRAREHGEDLGHVSAFGRLGSIGDGVWNAIGDAPQGGLHPISDPGRQLLRPLVHGLIGDANRIGGGCDRAAEKFDGFCLEHVPLNHSSDESATMVHTDFDSLETMVSYNERLQQALALAKVDKRALAAHLGISYTGMEKALDGRTKALTAANNARAAAFLQIDPCWLATGEGEPRSERVWPYKRLTPRQWGSISQEARELAENMLLSAVPPLVVIDAAEGEPEIAGVQSSDEAVRRARRTSRDERHKNH